MDVSVSTKARAVTGAHCLPAGREAWGMHESVTFYNHSVTISTQARKLAACRLAGSLAGLLAGRPPADRMLAGWLAGWLFGWLAGWMSGWLAGWLPRLLAGWLAGRPAG